MRGTDATKQPLLQVTRLTPAPGLHYMKFNGGFVVLYLDTTQHALA